MDARRITAQEVKRLMEKGEQFVFIDTRNPRAWETSNIKLPDARRIPIEEIENRLQEIPVGLPIMTYCT